MNSINTMKILCPSCRIEIDNWVSSCTVCGFMTETIEGFEAWAPEIAKTGTGKFFHLNSFKKLAALEDANFWFQARNELLLWALNHYFAGSLRNLMGSFFNTTALYLFAYPVSHSKRVFLPGSFRSYESLERRPLTSESYC